MTKHCIIGDVHGKFEVLNDFVKENQSKYDKITQLGDMGIAFPGEKAPDVENYDVEAEFICGNHENYHVLKNIDNPNCWNQNFPVNRDKYIDFFKTWDYKSRGTVENNILYIGGASSVDKHNRIPGRDWWDAENISFKEQVKVLNNIKGEQIDIVFSHCAPLCFDIEEFLSFKRIKDPNRRFLAHIFEEVRPKMWFSGHYHQNISLTYKDCEYRCIKPIDTGDFFEIEV